MQQKVPYWHRKKLNAPDAYKSQTQKISLIDSFIHSCLMPISAVFHLYPGMDIHVQFIILPIAIQI